MTIVDPAELRYKPGWSFRVGGPLNRYLCVFARTADSLHPNRGRVTQHMFELPDTDCRRVFAAWLLDRLIEAERHETCEFLTVAGVRPFWPNHQDEGSPYALVSREVPCRCVVCQPSNRSE